MNGRSVAGGTVSFSIMHFEREGCVIIAIFMGNIGIFQLGEILSQDFCINSEVHFLAIENAIFIQINPESASGNWLEANFVEGIGVGRVLVLEDIS